MRRLPAFAAYRGYERQLSAGANAIFRPVAVVEREGKLSLNVGGKGRGAGLPAERPA